MSEQNPLDVELMAPEPSPARALSEHEEAHDWVWFMASPRGRRIFGRLRNECGLETSSFAADGNTDFREGRRSIGLYLEQRAQGHALDSYIQFLLETK
jgi:hypothetical protein